MNLIKENWSKEDCKEFEKYLLTLSKGVEKSAWEQKIINTKLTCIAVPALEVKSIINQIAKGNYLSFIEHWWWNNFTETIIIGGLICKIKDFVTFKHYILSYIKKCDNWASCDCLKFNIKYYGKQNFFRLAKELCQMKLPFERRLGLIMLLKLINYDFIDQILLTINEFTKEKEYYVNMANAWLLAECFIKERDKTIHFLNNHKLNKFTINKAICKCRDSFRVSSIDKEMLLQYRQ